MPNTTQQETLQTLFEKAHARKQNTVAQIKEVWDAPDAVRALCNQVERDEERIRDLYDLARTYNVTLRVPIQTTNTESK